MRFRSQVSWRFCFGGFALALSGLFIGCPPSSPPGLGFWDLGHEVPIPDEGSPDGFVSEEVGPRPCLSPEDCPQGLLCDPQTGLCVECVTNQDCPGGQWCQEGTCVQECVPNCAGRECGNNGCGGVCGVCETGWTCIDGRCYGDEPCRAGLDCLWTCKDDSTLEACIEGCAMPLLPEERKTFEALVSCLRNSCDSAPPAGNCWWQVIENQCRGLHDACIACTPSCAHKECGPDGCGGSCGTCAAGESCIEGRCSVVCTPNCEGKACGDNGCGGVCGVCDPGWTCLEGQCHGGEPCRVGLDCLWTCKDDSTLEACIEGCAAPLLPEERKTFEALVSCLRDYCDPAPPAGNCWRQVIENQCRGLRDACIACTPSCAHKECGPDGCGGSCGTCPLGTACEAYRCEPICIPQCAGRECGPDGCGGQCGACPQGHACKDGKCVCVPQCFGKQCGPDGCGGSCGTCPSGQICNASGVCVLCTPKCQGKECGPDGCGGSCGTCQPGSVCQGGKCVCVPQCAGKECGPDGCGGSCGTCPVGLYCTLGRCQQECMPNCIGKHCGPDGCGGSCGACPSGYYCSTSQQCLPSCVVSCLGKECGPDGCGGQCGTCGADEYCSKEGQCLDFWSCFDILVCSWGCAPPNEACRNQCFTNGSPAAQKQWIDLWKCLFDQCGTAPPQSPCWSQAMAGACKNLYYQCLDCTPNCIGKSCGPDGCGGSCGTCPGGAACDEYGQCPCVPKCSGKECGPDGCGGLCGTCAAGLVCNASGRCVCLPQCSGKECGPDGCGGSCGTCAPGFVCNSSGRCVCQPQCSGKECGPDGCGGSCGTCPPGYTCTSLGQCQPPHEKGCADAVQCILSCGGLSWTCIQGCMSGLSPQSQQLLTQLAICLVQACGFNPSNQCIMNALNGTCRQQYLACMADGGGLVVF